MPAAVLILVPLSVCLPFAAAVHLLWRQTGRSAHGASWLAALCLIALGWSAAAIETVLAPRFAFPGGAVGLCWFAAALLGARGIRQRAGPADRGLVLLAIWVGTAIGVALLMDLAFADAVLSAAMAGILIAGGCVVAMIAVGPRNRRAVRSAWVAAGLIGLFGTACLAISAAALQGSTPASILPTTAMVSVPLLVLLGLFVVLALNEDRACALDRLARTDSLTGVWNRRGFDEASRHLLARLHATGGDTAAVAIADIDGFKGINDVYGHAVGDATLMRFADTLRAVTEPGDLLARLGGEEFALLAIGIDGHALHQRMERVRSMLCLPSIDPHGRPTITASFGVATLDADHRLLREALERADRALYRAKSEGRNRVTLAE